MGGYVEGTIALVGPRTGTCDSSTDILGPGLGFNVFGDLVALIIPSIGSFGDFDCFVLLVLPSSLFGG